MAQVEDEIQKMFDRLIENFRKADILLRDGGTVKAAGDRFLKLAKRMYDVYKLFLEEFSDSVDVVAAKAMLMFIRSCYVVSRVLSETEWVKMHNAPTFKRLKSIPGKAAHKVIKRTVRKRQYDFNHTEEDYRKAGLCKIYSSGNSRLPEKELKSISISIRQFASRLLKIYDTCDLVDNSYVVEESDLIPPSSKDFTLNLGIGDLKSSASILQDYYKAVIFQLATADHGMEYGLALEVNHDICLLPLLPKLNLKERKLLRGYTAHKTRGLFVDLCSSEDDWVNVTRKILLLEEAPKE